MDFSFIKNDFITSDNMDQCPPDFMSDEWPSSPDDFLDSIFTLNSDLLTGLDDPNNDITSNLMDTTKNERISPISTEESDFVGFTEADLYTGGTTMNHLNVGGDALSALDNQQLMSSSASDSGLSSDNLDLEMSPYYEPLSPTLSSPGPSISERGGQNSPPRFSSQVPVQKPAPIVTKTTPTLPVINTYTKKQQSPKVVVEKVQNSDGSLMFNKNMNTIQLHTASTATLTTNLTSTPPKEVKIYRMTPMGRVNNGNVSYINTSGQNKKVTIQLKNSSGTGSILNNKQSVIINKNTANLPGIRKLIRVQNPATNPRSILLPVSLQDVKDFRTIKIINASNLKNKHPNIKLAAANLLQQSKQGLLPKNVLVSKDQLLDDSMSDHTSDAESYVFEDIIQQSKSAIAAAERHHDDNNSSDQDDMNDDNISDDQQTTPHPKLILTTEEKRLLAKEGITLPNNYPLTKHEERELKRIRRKIRNKISAQDSRKRKKEYVDGLEERVKQCTEENQSLMKRIKMLQNQNHNLVSQMKKLQTLLTKGTNTTAQPATCLMVLLLSMALIAAPNLKLGKNVKDTELADAIQESMMSQQNRRNLLFDSKEQFGDALVDEEMNLEDIMAMGGLNDATNEFDDDLSPAAKKEKLCAELDLDESIWKPDVCYDKDKKSDSGNDGMNEFRKQAKQFQENLKTIQSSGFNIENTKLDDELDRDLQDMMSLKANGIYEVNLDKIASITKGNDIAELDIAAVQDKFIFSKNDDQKLNASTQISGKINRPKLIVQDV